MPVDARLSSNVAAGKLNRDRNLCLSWSVSTVDLLVPTLQCDVIESQYTMRELINAGGQATLLDEGKVRIEVMSTPISPVESQIP